MGLLVVWLLLSPDTWIGTLHGQLDCVPQTTLWTKLPSLSSSALSRELGGAGGVLGSPQKQFLVDYAASPLPSDVGGVL